MNNYVISSDFVEEASADALKGKLDKFFDVFLPFAQDNSYKIYIDNNRRLITEYTVILTKNDCSKTILDLFLLIEEKNPIFFERMFCMCKKNINTARTVDELCLLLASKTQSKRLISNSKETYLEHHSKYIKKKKITIIDGDEAKQQLNTHTTTINQTSYGLINLIRNLIQGTPTN